MEGFPTVNLYKHNKEDGYTVSYVVGVTYWHTQCKLEGSGLIHEEKCCQQISIQFCKSAVTEE